MRVVVDAGVAVKWYAPEIYEAEAKRLPAEGYEMHAPELIVPEFGNVIWKKVRRGEMPAEGGLRVLDSFRKVSITLHRQSNLLKAAGAGAFRTGLTVYDWTYLTLATQLSCPFVTADAKFYRALEPTSMKKHLLWVGDL